MKTLDNRSNYKVAAKSHSLQISNDNSTQIAATIGSDGIFRFQIDATDENTRKFVEILQRTFGPIKGVEATEVQPPPSKEKP